MGHWRRFGVFIVNFQHISYLCSRISIVNFEQVNAGWKETQFMAVAAKPSSSLHIEQ